MLLHLVGGVCVALAAFVAWIFFGVWKAKGEYPTIPEPKDGESVLGHMGTQASLPAEEAHWYVVRNIVKLGKMIRLRALGTRYLVVGSPELVNKVATEDLTKYKRSTIYEYFRPWLGKGILLSDGEEWKWRRKILSPAFSDGALRETFFLMIEMADKLSSVFAAKKSGEECDFEKECKSFTLDLFGKAGMNYDFNAMDSQSKDITNAFRIVMGEQQDRLNVAWMPYWMYKLTPKGREFTKNCAYLRGIVKDVIKVRRKEGEDELRRAKDPFSKLLMKGAAGDKTYEDEELVDDILTLIFAGHESTSCLIGFGMYELLRNPEFEEKLLQNVRDVVGDGPLEEPMLKECEFLERFLKEVLRFYTPIPGISKNCSYATKLGDITVEPGTDVDLSLLSVHHDPAIWKKPDVFDPDRFVPTANIPENAWCPFALGKRNCIGKSFAMMEARVFFMHVLPRIKFKLVAGQKIVPVSRINTNMMDGMLVTCELRTGPLSKPMPS